MPEKDSTQKGQTKNYKKMKNEIAGNKEEVAEPEEHRTEEVGKTEGNVKNERETQSHHYRMTCGGDKALINPIPNRHMEISTVTRRITTLAHTIRTQGLGGN